jgi:hypothetical protein
MSDNQTTAPVSAPTPPKAPRPDLTKIEPFVATRNGVSLSLTPFAGNRGGWDGVVYQAPQVVVTEGKDLVEDKAFLTSLQWYGKDNLAKMVNTYSKRAAQDAHVDSIPDTDNQPGFPEGSKAGVFVESVFISKIEKFAAASQRISELIELYEDAVKVYTAASTDMFAEIVDAAGDKDKIEELRARFAKLAKTVNSYKLEIDERRNRKSKEVETNTVIPE